MKWIASLVGAGALSVVAAPSEAAVASSSMSPGPPRTSGGTDDGLGRGGLHEAQSQSVALDEIAAEHGLEKGGTYPLDIVHAERKSQASTFRVDTSIAFTNCDPIFTK